MILDIALCIACLLLLAMGLWANWMVVKIVRERRNG
jgi:hypothetical protein